MQNRVIALLGILVAASITGGCVGTASAVRIATVKVGSDSNGNVTSLTVVKSTGDPALDAKAKALARKKVLADVPKAARASGKMIVVPVKFD